MTNDFKNKVDSYLSSEVGRLFIRYKNLCWWNSYF